MVDRKTVQRAALPYCQVVVVGTMGDVGLLVGREPKVTAEGEIGVNEDRFRVLASGKLAQELAGLPKGSLARIVGRLKWYRWTRRDREERERVVIEAETIELIERPERRKRERRP